MKRHGPSFHKWMKLIVTIWLGFSETLITRYSVRIMNMGTTAGWGLVRNAES